jgi:shikimate dehydrogenase
VLGHPIGHSLSPPMHNAALRGLSRTEPAYSDWRYFRFDIPPEKLTTALTLLRRKGFRGVNLTVPHKVLAFGQVTAVDDDARPIGAVNTLLATPDGWRGFNTDGYGLAVGLRSSLGLGLAGANVILLGAGGAARGAAVECLRQRCAALWIANRTAANREVLFERVRPLAGSIPLCVLGDGVGPGPGAIVINSTSAGLRPDDPPAIDLAGLPRPAGVYDMIYNPPQTSLLRQAEKLGIPGANGLTMLVHQGAKALEIWTGVPAARTAPFMLQAAQAALARPAR